MRLAELLKVRAAEICDALHQTPVRFPALMLASATKLR
jgi:hypothetical protein